MPKDADTLLPPARGGPHVVVALTHVLLPLTPDLEVHGLPVLDVVVTGMILEHVRPVVAGQVPVANSGHQVPDGSSEFNKLVYLWLGSRHHGSLLLEVRLGVILNSRERDSVNDINMDCSAVF